jgi:WD40 repeat protein
MATKKKKTAPEESDESDDKPTGKFITLGNEKASYSVDALTLSGDGKTLAATGWFGGSELYAFKMNKRREAIAVKRPSDALRHIALSPDGSILYGARKSDDGVPPLWEITRTRLHGKGPPLKSLATFDEDEMLAIALRPDGAVLATAVGDALVLWDTSSGEELESRRGSALSACKFGADGETIVGINQKGAIAILDATTLNRIAIVATSDKRLCHLATSNDRVALASYNPKSPIRVFSISQKKTLFTLPQHDSGGIAALAFSHDGSRLASAGDDGHVRVWDVEKKTLIANVRGKQEAMSDVVFLDNNHIAAGGRDVTRGPPIYIWTI